MVRQACHDEQRPVGHERIAAKQRHQFDAESSRQDSSEYGVRSDQSNLFCSSVNVERGDCANVEALVLERGGIHLRFVVKRIGERDQGSTQHP